MLTAELETSEFYVLHNIQQSYARTAEMRTTDNISTNQPISQTSINSFCQRTNNPTNMTTARRETSAGFDNFFAGGDRKYAVSGTKVPQWGLGPWAKLL